VEGRCGEKKEEKEGSNSVSPPLVFPRGKLAADDGSSEHEMLLQARSLKISRKPAFSSSSLFLGCRWRETQVGTGRGGLSKARCFEKLSRYQMK